jgi:hypothetical protein
MPATNNVIWSLATGVSHDHSDPTTKHLTACLVKHFKNFSPENIQMVLMSNSLLYTKIRKALGLPIFASCLQDIKEMISEAISQALPDTTGNYIERGLAEIEKDESKSAFIKRIGKEQLQEQLLDLFAAGKV